MSEVAAGELRSSTRSLLNRVEAGETITITVDGHPTALLPPIGRRRRWMARDEFASRILATQSDSGMTDDLDELAVFSSRPDDC